MKSLTNKTALVTGASRGIGASIAIGFARAGARVAVNYVRDETAAREVVDLITAEGGDAIAVQADIGKLADHRTMLDAIRASLGPVDILVNNAGVEVRTAALDCSESDWDWQTNVNLKGVFFLTQAVAREMASRSVRGRIINVSSTHETRPLPLASIYNITKGGLAMLTKSFALELAQHGITVNALIPGAIRTDMNKAVLADPAYEAKVLSKIPLGHLATPDALVAAAVFMASDASAYMTGSNVTLDGGLSL